MSRRINFKFNTALSAIEGGKFNDEAFKALVMPIRTRLMEIDGLTGCNIARYGIEVSYEKDIVSKTKLIRLVCDIFASFAEQADTYFPLRGNKVPRLIVDRPRRQRSTEPWVYINYKSSVVRYPVGTGQDSMFDEAKFRALTAGLPEKMTDKDGVLGWKLNLRYAGIKIDTRVLSIEEAKTHLTRVFTRAVTEEGKDYFPYLEVGEPLKYEFVVSNI
jgi:hypothetical protein